MAKATKKKLKAQVTNIVQRQYKDKMDCYENRISLLTEHLQNERKQNAELMQTNYKLQTENLELKQIKDQYEEWVERMQDFCNLPENERQQAFKTYIDGIKAKSEADEAMARIGRMYSSLTSIFMR